MRVAGYVIQSFDQDRDQLAELFLTPARNGVAWSSETDEAFWYPSTDAAFQVVETHMIDPRNVRITSVVLNDNDEVRDRGIHA